MESEDDQIARFELERLAAEMLARPCAVCQAPYREHGPNRPHDNPARGCRAFTYGESVS